MILYFYGGIYPMRLIEWEISEDSYEEHIVIPKEKRDLADDEGISKES